MNKKYLKERYSSIGIKLGGCGKPKKTHKKVRSKKIKKRTYKIIKFSSLLKK